MSFAKLLFIAVSSSVFVLPTIAAEDINDSPQRDLTGFESAGEIQPLWEFGVGGGAFETSNYPASSERNLIVLAAPYMVYRGDVIRIGGGNGLRAVVVEKSDFEFDVSFGGAFPADSPDDSVRAGMPELDFLFEVGPQLIYRVKDYEFEEGGDGRLKARLQARAAFSTDFEHVDTRGYVVEPTITYQQRGRLLKDTALNVAISTTFATNEFQEYFYQVDAPFAVADRMQYNAKGGYLGSSLSVSVSFPIGKTIRTFVSGSAKFHNGAANEESPLFEKNTTYSFGVGFVWRMYESEKKASW